MGGLNRFNPGTGQFKAYRFNANDPHSLSDDIVRSLYRDSNGVLWVGGWNNGLSRFDRTTETFKRYEHDPSDPTSLGGGSVTDIYEDGAKNLWVATEGGVGAVSEESFKAGEFNGLYKKGGALWFVVSETELKDQALLAELRRRGGLVVQVGAVEPAIDLGQLVVQVADPEVSPHRAALGLRHLHCPRRPDADFADA